MYLSPKKLIVIAGPTATGKTAASIELARHYNTVIVSADSRQFYREMCIGTAKPTDDELAAVKHYFINSHSITDDFNAGDYETACLKLLDELFKLQDKVILVGGSGLFIKAVCEGFDQLPTADKGIRDRLNLEFIEHGIISLQEKLSLADPEYYNQVDLNNPQRIIRALEVFESTDKPFSYYRKATVNQRPFGVIKLGLNMERDKLYGRINKRVDDMIKQGLLDEVRTLLPYRYLNSLNTVGYSELVAYLEGAMGLDAAIELIKQNTRRFAKRQITWFGKDKEITWFAADKPDLVDKMIEFIDSVTKN